MLNRTIFILLLTSLTVFAQDSVKVCPQDAGDVISELRVLDAPYKQFEKIKVFANYASIDSTEKLVFANHGKESSCTIFLESSQLEHIVSIAEDGTKNYDLAALGFRRLKYEGENRFLINSDDIEKFIGNDDEIISSDCPDYTSGANLYGDVQFVIADMRNPYRLKGDKTGTYYTPMIDIDTLKPVSNFMAEFSLGELYLDENNKEVHSFEIKQKLISDIFENKAQIQEIQEELIPLAKGNYLFFNLFYSRRPAKKLAKLYKKNFKNLSLSKNELKRLLHFDYWDQYGDAPVKKNDNLLKNLKGNLSAEQIDEAIVELSKLNVNKTEEIFLKQLLVIREHKVTIPKYEANLASLEQKIKKVSNREEIDGYKKTGVSSDLFIKKKNILINPLDETKRYNNCKLDNAYYSGHVDVVSEIDGKIILKRAIKDKARNFIKTSPLCVGRTGVRKSESLIPVQILEIDKEPELSLGKKTKKKWN